MREKELAGMSGWVMVVVLLVVLALVVYLGFVPAVRSQAPGSIITWALAMALAARRAVAE